MNLIIENKRNIVYIMIFILTSLLLIATYNSGFSLYQMSILVSTIIVNVSIVIILNSISSLIWYKKMLINKYDNKNLLIKFSAFDHSLKKFNIKMKGHVDDYFVTDNRDLVFKASLENGKSIFFITSLFGNSINLSDRFGNNYDYDKIQISPNGSEFKYLYEEIESLRLSIPEFINLNNIEDKVDKWTIDPESFQIKILKS